MNDHVMDGDNDDVDFDDEAMDVEESNSNGEEFCEEEQGSIVDAPSPLMTEVDTTEVFRTDLVFESKEVVLDHVKRCGRTNGVVVVVNRSDVNDLKRTPRILLGCERSGGYRKKAITKRRRSSTKKCGCPFSLKAYVSNASSGSWSLVVLNGVHNHALVKAFEGHSYIGRLSKEEKEIVERLSMTGLKTRDILNQIKLKDPTNASTMKTVYNARTALKIHETAGRSHMQQLFKLLTENGYVTRHRSEETIDAEMEILWTTFAAATRPQKIELKRQLQALAKASTTGILEPTTKVNLRGRKKVQRGKASSQTVDKTTKREPSAFEHALENHVFDDVQQSQTQTSKQRGKLKVYRTRNAKPTSFIAIFLDFIQPYISNVVDVLGDGHCGFRVVGDYYGWEGDSGWKIVRQDLATELRKNGEEYDRMLALLSSTLELLSSVECQAKVADTKNWMIMPYMGNVISSCYKVVVVLISNEQCLTFFPLKDPLPLDYNQALMVFGYINDSHFIRLELQDDSPLPPVSKMWLDHHHSNSRAWQVKFASRMKKFVELSSSKHRNMATVEIIN